MFQSTLNSPIVLALNRLWQATGHRTVRDAIVAMCGGQGSIVPAMGLDIHYAQTEDGWDFSKPLTCEPVSWERWMTLPIREYDLSVQTPTQAIRVPTVIITPNYEKMPMRSQTPSRESIFLRDKGVDQYTGQYIPFHEGNLDHVHPRDKGGPFTFENLVWTKISTNSKKGNKFPHEAGLRLIRPPFAPRPIPAIAIIKPLHRDWKHFLIH